MMALINPRLGRFNVTAKGGVVKRTFFDSRIAQPFLVMLIFNLLGLIFAIPRFFIWDRDRQGTVLMNVMWCCFNVVILGVCTAVARELQQRRATVRIRVVAPLAVKLPDGRVVAGETVDISSGGTSIHLSEPVGLTPEAEVHLSFPASSVSTELPATVVFTEGPVLRVCFKVLTIAEQEALTIALYSRADSWLGWGEGRESDQVLRSLARIFQISMRGLKATAQSILGDKEARSSKSTPLSIAPSAILSGWSRRCCERS